MGRSIVLLCLVALSLAAQARTLDRFLARLTAPLNEAIRAHQLQVVLVGPYSTGGGRSLEQLEQNVVEALMPHVKHAARPVELPSRLLDGTPVSPIEQSRWQEADAVLLVAVTTLHRSMVITCRLVSSRSGKVLATAEDEITEEEKEELEQSFKTITQEAAISVARQVTTAIGDGNSAAISKLFGYELNTDIVAIRRSFEELRPYVVRNVKADTRKMSHEYARLMCRQETFAIAATIRDDDHRIVHLAVSESNNSLKPSPHGVLNEWRLVEAEFKSFADDLERASNPGALSLPRVEVSGAALRADLCGKAPIVAFERANASPVEVFSVFLSVDGNEGSIPIRVDVKRNGRIGSWEMLSGREAAATNPTQSSLDVAPGTHKNQPLDEKPHSPPRKEVVRQTLERNVPAVRHRGRQELASLNEYGIAEERYVLADQAIPTVARVREWTMEALAAPELEPLRRWVTVALDTARPVIVERTMVVNGNELAYRLVPVSAVRAFKAAWEESLTKLEKIRDIAPDIRIVSEPVAADYRLFIEDDTAASYRGQTTDVVKNVYRGFYDLVVEKAGHKPCKPCVKENTPHKPCVDLVDDPRTTIKCELVHKKSEEECKCHRE